MRKAFSLVLLAIFVSSAVVPVSAQKSRNMRHENIRPVKNHTSFESVRAVSGGGGVYIEWTMEAETNNFGFLVYKRGKGGPELLNAEKVVAGSALRFSSDTHFGGSYSYFDRTGLPGDSYFVESVSMEGKRNTSRAVNAEFSMNVRSASGESFSAESTSAVQAANSMIELRRLSLSRELTAAVKAGSHRPNAQNHAAVMERPGVRIGVKKEGMYRVTRQQLEENGFSGGANPSLWQLHLDGVEQAIIVGPNGSYVEFYGKGVDTHETDTQMYYLTVGNTPGMRIANHAVLPGANSPVSPGYLLSHFQKERIQFTETIINGPAENYFGRTLFPGELVTIPVNLTGVDRNGPNVVIEIKLQGVNGTIHNVEVSLNGTALPPINYLFARPFSATYSVPASALRDVGNEIQLKSAGGTNDFNWFDSITVWYQRRYVAQNNAFTFYTKGQQAAKLQGFTSSNIRVFDITNVDEPVAVTGLSPYASGNTWNVDLPAGNPKVMFAVENSGLLNSVSIEPIDTTLLRNPSNEADLVIITYKDFLNEAETWADYRRGQGVKAVVAEVSDVYDEFNYGKKGPDAVEKFLNYAVNNWQTPPQYVLLIGDATYDPRNYEGKPDRYLVPTRFVDTLHATVPSDESMADFDNDGLSELAIGRIPARTSAEVTLMFNKTMNWEASLSTGLARGALFAYDAKDVANNLDFGAISTQFSNELPQSMPKKFVGKPEVNSTTKLINEINTGKYVVNYEGHGLTRAWANTFFNAANVPSLTNAGQESIFLMLTCYNGAFALADDLSGGVYVANNSLGEELMKYPNGGAVSAWSSPSKTTIEVHQIMGKRFFQQLGAGNINRLGDLVRDAKATLNAGPEIRFGWVLMGDPMLKTK